MKEYLIAVDGGGTKTEFCISDIEGKVIGSCMRGPTNYKSAGIKEMKNNLKSGFSELLEMQNITISDIAYAVFGMSGCDSKEDFNIIMSAVKELNIPNEKFYLCNDGILAFYGASAPPGIIVVSGTGSITFGIDKEGNIKRSGGWGYPFSSLGSGAVIGIELLKRTLLYCDGNYEYSRIFDDVREYFKSETFNELPYKISGITKKHEVAALSRLVTGRTNENEPVALEILNQAADYLSMDIRNVYKAFNFENEEKINIVFSGGNLKDDLYSSILKEKVNEKISKENIIFLNQQKSPAQGGIKLAQKLYKGVLNERKI